MGSEMCIRDRVEEIVSPVEEPGTHRVCPKPGVSVFREDTSKLLNSMIFRVGVPLKVMSLVKVPVDRSKDHQ